MFVYFRLRLGINCSEDLLKVAFCDSIPSQEKQEEVTDNKELVSAGKCFLEMFLSHYINIVFPLIPSDAKSCIQNYLIAPSTLSHVAFNLGYQVCYSFFGFAFKKLCDLAIVYIATVNS